VIVGPISSSFQTLWQLEIANTLLTLVRRKKIDREGYLLARTDLQTSESDHRPRRNNRLALTAISEPRREHRMTVYDAATLSLRCGASCHLASRDSALNQSLLNAASGMLNSSLFRA